MADFFSHPIFIVMTETRVKKSRGRKSRRKPNVFEIVTPKGIKLAEMILRPPRFPFSFFRKIDLVLNYPFMVTIQDLQQRPLMLIGRSFNPLAGGRIEVYDEKENPIGFYDPPSRARRHKGRTLEVLDREGMHCGSICGNWETWNMQILDAKDTLIGRISKNTPDVDPVIFSETHYYLIRTYMEPEDDVCRRLLKGAALSIDLILRF